MKIDKGIERGPAKVGRPAKYPFAEMTVGDSFLSPSRTAVYAACNYGRRHGQTYCSERQDTGQYRIWRNT